VISIEIDLSDHLLVRFDKSALTLETSDGNEVVLSVAEFSVLVVIFSHVYDVSDIDKAQDQAARDLIERIMASCPLLADKLESLLDGLSKDED
jgi:hypothetical protein